MNQATSAAGSHSSREPFIPVPLAILTETLSSHLGAKVSRQRFDAFAEGLTLLYDARFSQRLELLKRLYYPHNPDRPDMAIPFEIRERVTENQKKLIEEIETLLRQANFQRLDQEALNLALNKTSPEGVTVSVDLDEFDEVLIYYCGSASRTLTLPLWKRLLGKRRAVTLPIYRRLFVLLKFRPDEKEKERDSVFIKLFKEIPQSDLETIFPNTKVRLSLFDKVKLGVTGGGGVAAGVVSATGKLATAAANPMAAAGALGALGGVVWKQVSNVMKQRTEYMAKLARNLYFYNLDNNAGALAWLIEMASSEEAKEALLAYGFLLAGGAMERETLDREIEDFMRDRFKVEMDFEVEDGLRKLRDLELLEKEGAKLRVKDLETAFEILKEKWVAVFPVPETPERRG